MPKWSILIENKIDNIKDFQEACFQQYVTEKSRYT